MKEKKNIYIVEKKKMDLKTLQVKRLEEEKLKKLAEDPQNLVYHYVDRKQVAKKLPIKEVKRIAKNIWNIAKKLPQKEAAIRRQIICDEHSDFLSFSETHPDIFDRLTHPDTDQTQYDAFVTMFNLFEKDPSDRGKTKMQSYILKNFAVSKEQYQKENPTAQIRKL